MNICLSSAQLKSLSKEQLLGKYGPAIGAQFTVGIITSAVTMLCSLLTDETTTAGFILSYAILIILDVLSGIFQAGLTRFYLNLVCNCSYYISDVFSGFRFHADRAIAVRFLILVMQLIGLIPCMVFTFLLEKQESPVMFLLCSITLVIGGIIYVIVFLLYSQAYYIMLDFPGYSVRQIMSGSRNIMKGHKGRLFYICVTLIPYYLLGFLSCGIALFWVIPYTKVILTNFYLDLVHAQSSSLI